MCRSSLREKAQGVLGEGELPCFPRLNRGEDCCKHLRPRPHRLSTGAIGVQHDVEVIVDRGMIGPAAGQPREEGGKPTEAEGAVPVAGERWTFLGGWAAAGRRGIPWSATGHRGGDAARSWRGKAHGAPIGLAAAGRLTSYGPGGLATWSLEPQAAHNHDNPVMGRQPVPPHAMPP